MEFYAEIRDSGLLIHKIAWLNLKCIFLSVKVSPNFSVPQQMLSDKRTNYIQVKRSCVPQCRLTTLSRTFFSCLFYCLALFTFTRLGGVGAGGCLLPKDCEVSGDFAAFQKILEYAFYSLT